MLNIISRSVYQKHPAGPKKVVDNLIKGLQEIGVPYVLNKHPFDSEFTWIHDDPDAIQYLFEHDTELGNTKFIFGPNTFYTPEEITWERERKEKCLASPLEKGTYIMPCEWVMEYWRKHGFAPPAAIWPVGVDTEFFKPDAASEQKKTDKVLVYAKRRAEKDIKAITDFLDAEKISYSFFSYGSYSEEELIEAAKTSKFGIIIGSSESQGLAIQEMQSLDLPLAVFDIDHLNQQSFNELDSELKDLERATSVPYFDPTCGLIAKTLQDMQHIIFEMMRMENLSERFSPRKFIIQNFSLKKQAVDFLNIMKYPLPGIGGSLDNTETKHMRNWKNRTWYRPILAIKYAIKHLQFKLKI